MRIQVLAKVALLPLALLMFSSGVLRADSITSGWQEIGLIGGLPLPGAPSDSYTWTGDSPFGPNPFDDPLFNLFAQNGGFLSTSNSSYHFNGTPEITLWSSFGSGGGGTLMTRSQAASAVPEPSAFWLLAGGFTALAAFGAYRVRRINEPCSASRSETLSCSARMDRAPSPLHS